MANKHFLENEERGNSSYVSQHSYSGVLEESTSEEAKAGSNQNYHFRSATILLYKDSALLENYHARQEDNI